MKPSFLMNLTNIKRFIFMNIALILTGCAGDVNMLPTLTKDLKVTEQQGIVVVRIINASSYPLPFNQVTISPKNLNESKKIKSSRLQAISSPTTNSTIFSAPVKSGSYALHSIRAFHIRGDYWYSRWAGADAKFGTFDVKPGQITDLGTIVYYPKPQEDKYLNTVLRLPAEQPAEVLSTYFPFYDVADKQVLVWTEDEYQEDRDSLFTSVAQNPIVYNKDYVAPDNSVYFIGKLGVILKRDAEKEWSIDAVNSNLDLSAIRQSKHGDLAVGGDEGIVYFKQQGGEWQDISLPKSHHVEELYFDEQGNLEAISREEARVIIQEKSLTNLTVPWHKKASYASNTGWLDQHNKKQQTTEQTKKSQKKKPKRIVAVVTNRQADLNTITITEQSMSENFAFKGGDAKTFSFNADNWQVKAYENDSDISRVFNAGIAKLGVEYAGFWSLTGKPTYYKQDLTTGEWQKIATEILSCEDGYKMSDDHCLPNDTAKKRKQVDSESFTFTSVPWFSSNDKATAIASFSDYNFWSGKRSHETKIITTTDGGKSWQVTEYKLPNKYCTRLISKVVDSMLLSCNGISSDFYESNDNGATWQHVREQENF